MWVKICANTSLHDAQLAAELGADAVGFVFAPSKRRVTPAQVAAITPHLPAGVEKIGVFTPGDEPALREAVAVAGLTGVQLHGDFGDSQIEELLEASEGRLKLLQVVGYETQSEDPVRAREEFERRLAVAVRNPALWAVLLDAVKSGASGGLGLTFDWVEAGEIAARVYSAAPAGAPRLIVAGGLHASNVGEAISAFEPFGVDVASGVEASPGVKDPEKLRRFLASARGR